MPKYSYIGTRIAGVTESRRAGQKGKISKLSLVNIWNGCVLFISLIRPTIGPEFGTSYTGVSTRFFYKQHQIPDGRIDIIVKTMIKLI
jgi:hypothetical protein